MKRLQKRIADTAAQCAERNAPPKRDPREQDAFLRMAEVRAQQISAGMDPRTAQRTWERMTHEQTKQWVNQLVEALAEEWPKLDEVQRAERHSLIQHMDSFRRARGGDAQPQDPAPLWPLSMARAMFEAATEAWDRENVTQAQSVLTIDIPTGSISTLDVGLSPQDAQRLRDVAARRAREVFAGPNVAAYLADSDWSEGGSSAEMACKDRASLALDRERAMIDIYQGQTS